MGGSINRCVGSRAPKLSCFAPIFYAVDFLNKLLWQALQLISIILGFSKSCFVLLQLEKKKNYNEEINEEIFHGNRIRSRRTPQFESGTFISHQKFSFFFLYSFSFKFPGKCGKQKELEIVQSFFYSFLFFNNWGVK